MMRFLMVVSMLFLVACGGNNESYYTPDHKGQIDDNTARIDQLEKDLAALQADQEATEALIEAEIARLDKADQDNLDYLEGKLDDQVSRLVGIIRRGDRTLGYQIAMLRRQLYSSMRSNQYNFNRIYGQLRSLEGELDNAIEEFREADEDLLAKIKKNKKKNRELARKLRRFQAFQAGRDRGQDIMISSGFMHMYHRFSVQFTKVFNHLEEIDGDIDSLIDSVSGIEATINLLTSDLSDLTDLVGELSIDISGLSQDVEDIEGDFSDLEDQVDENSEDIADLEDLIEDLEQSQEQSSCGIEFRNVRRYHHSYYYYYYYNQVRGDIYAVCDGYEYKLRNNARLSNYSGDDN